MPQAMLELTASEMLSPVILIPALASAKSGTTKNAAIGAIASSRRSSGLRPSCATWRTPRNAS